MGSHTKKRAANNVEVIKRLPDGGAIVRWKDHVLHVDRHTLDLMASLALDPADLLEQRRLFFSLGKGQQFGLKQLDELRLIAFLLI